MPKNSWKILKSAITKNNNGALSGKEYVSLQHPIEDLLRCYGLDLCTYNPSSSKYNNTVIASVSTYTVAHNFGAYPLVQVIDSGGNVIIPFSIVHNSVNDFTVNFSFVTSGNIISIAG